MKRSEIRTFREDLRRFERLATSQFKGSSCCSGVTLAQCHVLLEIEAREISSLGELAQALGLDKSTLSRTVDAVVNIGLVDRVFDPRDRRSVRLSLTSQGQTTCDRINEGNDGLFNRVFERIEPAGQQTVLKSFHELVAAMEAEMGGSCPACAAGD